MNIEKLTVESKVDYSEKKASIETFNKIKDIVANLIYIEPESIKNESDEFRAGFKKVVRSIKSSTTFAQVETSRKLAKLFMDHFNISTPKSYEVITSKRMDRFISGEIYRGYIEYILDEQTVTYTEHILDEATVQELYKNTLTPFGE